METTMPQNWWPMPWFGMIFGPIIMIVFLVIAAMIGLALLRVFGFAPPWWSHRGDPSGQGSSRRALEILEERFAKGEIDKPEFEEKKRLLLR